MRRPDWRGAALLLAAALAGCAGPRPMAPPAAVVRAPDAWRDGTAVAEAPVDAAWWRAFGDPVLDGLVERALAGNPDIAVAVARVEEARAQFDLARAQQLPLVTAGGTGGEQRSVNAFGKPVEQSFGQAQATVAWDTDLFGRLSATRGAARAALLSTEAARDGVRLAIVSAAVSGYINLLALDRRLAILRETLESRQSAAQVARRRADAGYTSKLELAQAIADARATEQLIAPTELARRRQENGLAVLLGDMPAPIPRGAALEALTMPAVASSLPSLLLRRRPDIAQAEDQIVAADRSLDAARAAFLPSLQLSASGGAVESSLLANPYGVFTLGGSILATIFDSGRLQAQQQGAAARRDQAAFAYRKVVLNAFREVEDAIAEVQRTREQVGVLTAQRAEVAEVLRIARNRYQAGYSPYLDQLDAQRGLLSVELALAQAEADERNAAVRLYQALGGGWQRPAGG